MEELDLKELISMFLEKKLLIILVVIIFALMGAIYTLKFITPIYKSTTSLLLTQTTLGPQTGETTGITQSDLTLNSKLVGNYKKIAVSDSVASTVIKNLGLSLSIDEIHKSTVVTTSDENEGIEITVSSTDPELACKIANETAKVLIERARSYYQIDNADILDEAVVSLEPSNINLFKNIVIFAFVGGILVSGYILLINMLDTTLKTDLDIEKAVGLPVLASIVLTEDTTKKKKSKSSAKRGRPVSDLSFDNNTIKSLQQDYSNKNYGIEKNHTDDISMYSYTNDINQEKDDDENEEKDDDDIINETTKVVRNKTNRRRSRKDNK